MTVTALRITGSSAHDVPVGIYRCRRSTPSLRNANGGGDTEAAPTGLFRYVEGAAKHLPRLIDSYNQKRLHLPLGCQSQNCFEEGQFRKPVIVAA